MNSQQYSNQNQPEFATLIDKMFFNIFVYCADSSAHEFIHNYIPWLLKKDKGGWTAYKDVDGLNKKQEAVHSFIFYQHPIYKGSFSCGRLDIWTKERDGKVVELSDWELWFSLKDKKDAERMFDFLFQQFAKISTSHRFAGIDNSKFVEFKDEGSKSFFRGVMFFGFFRDKVKHDGYKFIFKIGSLNRR